MKKILCIIAGQRSGTTALQSALSSTGKFHNFGEIFQSTPQQKKGTFLDFGLENNLEFGDFFSNQTNKAIVDDYIIYLTDLSGSKIPLIDVKFNSWSMLKNPWSYPTEQPFFMERLKTANAAFLMLIRENLFDQIISEKIARRLNKWHNLNEVNIMDNQFSVDLNSISRQARLTLAAERFFFAQLRDYENIKVLKYEDLFANNTTPLKLESYLNAQFDIKFPKELRSSIRKNILTKRNIVSNYDAAKSVVDTIVDNFGKRPHQI